MVAFSSNGQAPDTAFVLPPLTVNSAIVNMALADSFSEAGDSINASKYYLKTDPFFFVSSGRTKETIDSDFVNYLLTRQAKAAYRAIFARAYNAERTVAYNVFKTMLAADQAVRHKLSSCRDSFSRAVVERQMKQTDSPHFEYLYNYVQKNGWPTYENGAMYAEVIAMHDGKHMQYYLPHIKRAVLKGNSCPDFYYNILNRARPSNVEQLRSYRNKVSFDISYVLKGYPASDTQTKEIQKAVRECGPIKRVYFLYEAADEKGFKDFMDMSKDENYWLAWDIYVEIGRAQRKYNQQENKRAYDFLYSQADRKQPRLVVYLVY